MVGEENHVQVNQRFPNPQIIQRVIFQIIIQQSTRRRYQIVGALLDMIEILDIRLSHRQPSHPFPDVQVLIVWMPAWKVEKTYSRIVHHLQRPPRDTVLISHERTPILQALRVSPRHKRISGLH